MERCPCCNARLREQPTCPRCKADLSPLINSEQAAKYCLSKAMDYWAEGNIEQGISTLKQSLALKKTQAAEAFLGFIIDQSHKDVLERLATQDILSTKKKLYQVQGLLPYSHSLQKTNDFADYLFFRDKNY